LAHGTILLMAGTHATFALDLGFLSLGPTPLAMLIAVLFLSVVVVGVVMLTSQVTGALIDRRWPADQPLTPSEVLWGEASGYVGKHFPGLDPTIARDLALYITTSKVQPGEVIIERGDLPSHFVLIKSGSADVTSAAGSTALKAGGSIGGDNILRRQAFDVMVTATAPTEVVRLPAEDYLAAVALGMTADDDDYVLHALGGYLAEPVTQANVAAPPPPPPAASAPAGFSPPAWQPQWPQATHRVVINDVPGYVLPAGDVPTHTLRLGDEVMLIEGLPGWAHVRSAQGWQGWIIESAIGR
jgi:hypothetical protein